MGLFSFLRKKSEETPEPEEHIMPEPAPVQQTQQAAPVLQPYKTDQLNTVYNLLFADDTELFGSNNTSPAEYPWNVLLSKDAGQQALQQVIADAVLDTRARVLACNKLLAAGHKPAEKELLGVIAEVSMDGGLDVLASFKDGTARYINQSGKMIVWENMEDSMTKRLTRELFLNASSVVEKIGPWDKKRLPYPPKGTVRLSFLVSDGLYFGQGPAEIFFKDPLAGPVLNAATQLMVYLMEQTPES